MKDSYREHLVRQLESVKQAGTWKEERIIATPQGAHIKLADGRSVLNMCANNYLGLAQHPEVVAAAKAALDRWGYGLASVRFICGTQAIHKQLEERLTQFLGTEDTILYSSCWDANGGVFETLLGPEDAVISDELNHASIIDGIRLCKAQRFRYKNNNLDGLASCLHDARNARFRLIVTDGVFSMDGSIARLDGICDLAEQHDALVMIDDSHAVGVLGRQGRGTHEHCNVMGRIDIITGTLGKALGGASGGYASGRREIIALLRQRSRPYLFSNTLAPVIAASSIKVLELLSGSTELRDRLETSTGFFRQGLSRLGFQVLPGAHPITPIMLGDAALATMFANTMLDHGVYVIGFSYPVVPQGKARIRTQVSALHSRQDLESALDAFAAVKKKLAV